MDTHTLTGINVNAALGSVRQKEIFCNCWRTFYSSDAIPVTQPTVSKHGRKANSITYNGP